ncbi:MAG: hypothetical protein M1840_006355 [Geoglossum simile]|nr:MAG: hypothetical protein M1840_006355 [Geoglossum simile]
MASWKIGRDDGGRYVDGDGNESSADDTACFREGKGCESKPNINRDLSTGAVQRGLSANDSASCQREHESLIYEMSIVVQPPPEAQPNMKLFPLFILRLQIRGKSTGGAIPAGEQLSRIWAIVSPVDEDNQNTPAFVSNGRLCDSPHPLDGDINSFLTFQDIAFRKDGKYKIRATLMRMEGDTALNCARFWAKELANTRLQLSHAVTPLRDKPSYIERQLLRAKDQVLSPCDKPGTQQNVFPMVVGSADSEETPVDVSSSLAHTPTSIREGFESISLTTIRGLSDLQLEANLAEPASPLLRNLIQPGTTATNQQPIDQFEGTTAFFRSPMGFQQDPLFLGYSQDPRQPEPTAITIPQLLDASLLSPVGYTQDSIQLQTTDVNEESEDHFRETTACFRHRLVSLPMGCNPGNLFEGATAQYRSPMGFADPNIGFHPYL